MFVFFQNYEANNGYKLNSYNAKTGSHYLYDALIK